MTSDEQGAQREEEKTRKETRSPFSPFVTLDSLLVLSRLLFSRGSDAWRAGTQYTSTFLHHFSTAPVSALVASAAYFDRYPLLKRGSGAVQSLARPTQFRRIQADCQRARRDVDLNDVTRLEQSDGPAGRGFRTDVSDAGTGRAAREAAVGDQRHFVYQFISYQLLLGTNQ